MPGRRWASTSSSTGSTRPASTTTSPSTRTRTASFRCCSGGRPDARRSRRRLTSTRGLLERSCKLGDDLGGGSLTGIPIVETQAGDVAAYIPTNGISITDGQIFLESDLFYSGVRPAINVGISVSRVGGSAQIKAMRSVAGRLRLDLSSTVSSRRSRSSARSWTRPPRAALNRGEKMVSTLNQPQYAPWPVEEQVVAIFAGTRGYLDDIPTDQVPRFQDELREFLRTEGSVLKEIRESGELSDELSGSKSRSTSSRTLQHPGREVARRVIA